MTKDDIIRMAREAGFQIANGLNGEHWPHCEGYDLEEEVDRFAALVAAAEREKWQADADRYRWLREPYQEVAGPAAYRPWNGGMVCGSDLDKEIDAARGQS